MQSELVALQLAIEHVNSTLVPVLASIVNSGTLVPTPPTHRGENIQGKFVLGEWISEKDGKAISQALETFSLNRQALDVHFNEMSILGVMNVWTYLTC